jgi:hypothetical protein
MRKYALFAAMLVLSIAGYVQTVVSPTTTDPNPIVMSAVRLARPDQQAIQALPALQRTPATRTHPAIPMLR